MVVDPDPLPEGMVTVVQGPIQLVTSAILPADATCNDSGCTGDLGFDPNAGGCFLNCLDGGDSGGGGGGDEGDRDEDEEEDSRFMPFFDPPTIPACHVTSLWAHSDRYRSSRGFISPPTTGWNCHIFEAHDRHGDGRVTSPTISKARMARYVLSSS